MTEDSEGSTEQMDLQILELRIEMEVSLPWPIAMEVDVEIGR